MQNAFGEEMSRPTKVKRQAWPVKLAMKAGAKTESQANIVVIVISFVLLVITFFVYKNTFFDSSSTNTEMTPAQERELREAIERLSL